jgi:hypothetical protein
VTLFSEEKILPNQHTWNKGLCVQLYKENTSIWLPVHLLVKLWIITHE